MKEDLLYKLLRPIVKILVRVIYNPKIIGKENIPESGRIILAGNHTHYFDCLLLMSSTKRQVHFLAKKELLEGPKGLFFSQFGLIPVDRKNKDHNALSLSYDYLNNDKIIGIFPEGTIGRNGILPFKMGAVKMANKTNSKIIPFVITGKYKPFKNKLTIEFKKQVEISDDLEKENDKLRNIIIDTINKKEMKKDEK